MEFKKLHDNLNKDELEIQEKDKELEESLAKQESLKQQLKYAKYNLVDAKHIIWDHLSIELKKLRDCLIEVEDERELATTSLANVSIIQKNMGDKPLKDFNAINYLNSRSKA